MMQPKESDIETAKEMKDEQAADLLFQLKTKNNQNQSQKKTEGKSNG